MGNFISSTYALLGFTPGFLGSPKPLRIIMFSLDAAGKTTILYQLKLGEIVTTIPTIGFNVETVTFRNISFTIWDVGGGDRIRPLWRHYLEETNACIFVVDSTDLERMPEARDDMYRYILESDKMDGKPLLIFANKQDKQGALSGQEITSRFELSQRIGVKRPWRVQESSALLGKGLNEGLEWLSNVLK